MYIYDNISPSSSWSEKVGETKINFILHNSPPQTRTFYEIMWKKYGRAGQATDDKRCTRFACWITKPTNTHSEYVTFISFPLQQWLQGHASLLRRTYIVCLANGVKGCTKLDKTNTGGLWQEPYVYPLSGRMYI